MRRRRFNTNIGKPSNDSQFFKGCLWVIVAAFILAFVGCMALMNSGSDEEFGEGEARYVCEQFVSDQLKSPGTADFQRPTGRASDVETWTMTGTVDAENSLGGTVRMSYVCTVRAAGGGEATLVDLDVVER